MAERKDGSRLGKNFQRQWWLSEKLNDEKYLRVDIVMFCPNPLLRAEASIPQLLRIVAAVCSYLCPSLEIAFALRVLCYPCLQFPSLPGTSVRGRNTKVPPESAKSCLWTVVCQIPQSMGFSRQEYWSGLRFPSPGDLYLYLGRLWRIFLPPDFLLGLSMTSVANVV